MRRQYYRPHNTYTPRRTFPYRCKFCENQGKRARFETHEELVEHRRKKHPNIEIAKLVGLVK